jgi:energy-coupling factor transporter ATP-binding protein EcfA2
LIRNEGVAHDLREVYIPLSLVEYKKPFRRQPSTDVPEKTIQPQAFQYEQFLEQVLRKKHSPASNGRRIALIGEPGAGKTTLLQQIAQWIIQEVQQPAIWVSLSALEGQTLETFLLKKWLKNGLQVANTSLEQENAFVEWVKSSKPWLMLDGVDEMAVGSNSPLQVIADQIGGWIAETRIVLTCRVNVWESLVRRLDSFDVYSPLELSYPHQVEDFIGKWFTTVANTDKIRSERLCSALREPGRERIQELVQNPLLLTLLCMDWYIREGELPETRADLYAQLVEDFYTWKQSELQIPLEKYQQLTTKLSDLALEAITTKSSKFWLSYDLANQLLGDPSDSESLFYLALKLGWLNKAGVDATNPRKPVHAFLHRTFEEYFAALGIAKQFNQGTLSLEQLQNEIFQQHWQDEAWYEVLLLICSLIDSKAVGEFVKYLTDLAEAQRGSCDELWEKDEEYWDENFTDIDDYLVRVVGIDKLLFAADCISEMRNRHELPSVLGNLLDSLDSITNVVERFGSESLHGLVHTGISLIDRIAYTSRGNLVGYEWLKREAMYGDRLQEYCVAAILGLEKYWLYAPTFVDDLIQIVYRNEFDSMTDPDDFSDESIDYTDSPRQAAMKVLSNHFSDHPEVVALLRDRATNDTDEQMQRWAANQLNKQRKMNDREV